MKILLIEDDLDDIELLQEGLGGFPHEMDIASDGGLALEYIRTNKGRPDLIVLDLNLPKIHGRDLILEIKASPLFRNIPLIILTTSSAKVDIEYAYKHGADKYLLKPTDSGELDQIIATIISFSQKKPV